LKYIQVISILLFIVFCFNKCKQKPTKPELDVPLIRSLHSYGIKVDEQTKLLVYKHDENRVYTNSDTTEWLSNDLIHECMLNKKHILNNKKNSDSTFLVVSKNTSYVAKKKEDELDIVNFKTLCSLLKEINDETFFSLLDEINIKSEFIFHANISPFTYGWCHQIFSGHHIYWTFRENKNITELLICLPQHYTTLFYKVENQYFTPSMNLKRGDLSVFYPFLNHMAQKYNNPLQKGINDTLVLSLAKSRQDSFVLSKREKKYLASLPFNYKDYIKPTLVEIQNVKNNEHHLRTFYKAEDGDISIVGFGETILKERKVDWEREEIAFIFDVYNEKQGEIIPDNQTFMFSFFPGKSYVSGKYNFSNGIHYKLKIGSDTLWMLEVAFPWEVLETRTPDKDKKMGFDISVTDNDGFGRESKLFWASEIDRVWKDMSTIGTLTFGKNEQKRVKTCNSLKIENRNIIIDGKYDEIWNHAEWNQINTLVLGRLNGKDDLSARFKSMYDEQCIYFYVRINDNKVWDNYGKIIELRDYVVVTDDENSNIVWKMGMDNTEPFAGENIIRKIDHSLYLKKGHYTLHYITNASVCPDDQRFINAIPFFYGVKIYEDK